MNRVLSIDPGLSTGVALGEYGPETPYTLVQAWQITGGLSGFLKWFKGPYEVVQGRSGGGGWITCAEKFQPISHANYALTTASVEPLRVEGALVALGLMPDFPNERWLSPKNQYFVGGTDLADKKKRSAAFLKANGMHLTGKTVGCADAADARSATLHGIAYTMKVLQHRQTFEMVQRWTSAEDETGFAIHLGAEAADSLIKEKRV